MRKLTVLFISTILILSGLYAQENEGKPKKEKQKKERVKPEVRFRAVAELGFLAVLDHKIQFGNSGTYFDYVKEGGQDVLFPVGRLSVEMDIGKHTLIFLYQPLSLKSEVLLPNDVTVDDLTFPANSGMRTVYNFPFYRLSYMKELLSKNDRFSLALGATIQIRNATISFESLDGSRFRSDRNIGIVPALKLRSGVNIGSSYFAEVEADGIYAPVSVLNGSDDEIVGAILDGSIRGGKIMREADKLFLNLRYLGGGAVGTDNDDTGPGDGYVKNWLHFMTVSLGYSIQF